MDNVFDMEDDGKGTNATTSRRTHRDANPESSLRASEANVPKDSGDEAVPDTIFTAEQASDFLSHDPHTGRIHRETLRHRQSTEVLWPHPAEAEALLAEHQANMARLFPFIVIRPDMTAAELRAQRPFLWKAVMMEACHLDGNRQIVLGNRLLKEISEAALTKPSKSVDLLQGLQILIAW